MYVLAMAACASQCRALEVKGNVWANLDVQMYGFIKIDASYDDSQTDPGNFVKWVKSETQGTVSDSSMEAKENDNEFNLTAKQTRFGFVFTGPETEDTKVSGRTEFDFYGDDLGENKFGITVRHAYVELAFKKKHLVLLAGQTSDVVSPLAPRTVNRTGLWWAGNVGYRRPQVRVTKDVELDTRKRLKLEGAIARTIGSNTTSGGLIAEDTGADAGHPTFQGRVSLTFPGLAPKPTTVGMSGHWGQEQHDYNGAVSVQSADVESWSGNLDVTLPLSDRVLLKGEVNTGANFSTYFGGIGQGVTGAGSAAVRAIRSTGGWIAATIGPCDGSTYNIGFGRQEAHENDLAAGGRQSNRGIFGNVFCQVTEHVVLAVELSHWETEYKSSSSYPDGKALRGQVALIYKN